jgi:hypothetical protein
VIEEEVSAQHSCLLQDWEADVIVGGEGLTPVQRRKAHIMCAFLRLDHNSEYSGVCRCHARATAALCLNVRDRSLCCARCGRNRASKGCCVAVCRAQTCFGRGDFTHFRPGACATRVLHIVRSI